MPVRSIPNSNDEMFWDMYDSYGGACNWDSCSDPVNNELTLAELIEIELNDSKGG